MPKDVFRHEVALRLKEARRQRALTQRQLANLGHSTQQNISRYEKGFIPDSWFLLARLHAEKAIDLNWLLASPPSSALEPRESNGKGMVAAVAADTAGEGLGGAVAARGAMPPPAEVAAAEPALAGLSTGSDSALGFAARGPEGQAEGRL